MIESLQSDADHEHGPELPPEYGPAVQLPSSVQGFSPHMGVPSPSTHCSTQSAG